MPVSFKLDDEGRLSWEPSSDVELTQEEATIIARARLAAALEGGLYAVAEHLQEIGWAVKEKS